MNRSLSAVLALGLVAVVIMAEPHAALSQGVFPPPPPTGSQGIFPAPPAPGQAGLVTGPATGEPMGGPGMGGPPAQAPEQCNNFLKLRDDAQKKGMAIQEAGKHHATREEMCGVVTRFFTAEATVLKFLVDNKSACGVPEVAITTSKQSHAKTQEFKDKVCAEGPKPKVPTLSDAIGTPNLDTAKNTKTGPGTFDTLTGNPLAR